MKIDTSTFGELANKWEEKYPVDLWMIEGIHIWPVLKRIIYFTIFRDSKNNHLEPGKFKLENVGRNIKKKLRFFHAYYHLFFLDLKKTNFLFSGGSSYRVNWEEKRFNRFFDPMLDYIESKGEVSYLLEYNKIDIKTVYKSQRVIDLIDFLPFFNSNKKIEGEYNLLEDLKDFNLFLNEVEDKTGVESHFLKSNLLKQINTIINWANLFSFFIKKADAKYTIGLCYYSNAMYGMNFASNKLGIKSIDMQHGLQGYLHPAYHFKKVPSSGYNILPKDFWVWETSSFQNINNWTHNSVHKAILGGNPWIDYFQSNKGLNDIRNEEFPMILFTLQLGKSILPDYFLDVIKATCKNYNWWFRYHPRTSQKEKEEIELKLNSLRLLDRVNIKDANNLPLPVLLNNCQLNISKNSGSIAEAAMMQRHSLIIDELGIRSYKDLIDRGLAEGCLSKNSKEIVIRINSILNNKKFNLNEQLEEFTYKTILDTYIQ